MQSDKSSKLVDLVTDQVEARLCANRIVPGVLSETERQAQLRADLEALSIRFSARETVIAQVRAEIAEHGFMVDKGNYQEQEPYVERLRPPDFGPEGPSDDDIQRELDDILKKIERLRTPEEGEEYEFKLPFRVQINVALLVSILLELLKLIMKLVERMRRIPQPSPAK
jgi:hypothetical protein